LKQISVFKFTTTFIETKLDENDDFVEDYEINLPHHDMIAKAAEKSWNDTHMEQYYDGILEDKVESAIMKCRKSKTGVSEAVINIKLKDGIRLTERYRNAIVQQTEAQLSDGWGESFFGYCNVMTDGKSRFIVE